MPHLTYEQLWAYAASAGAARPDVAAAVALAETSGTGDTNAHNAIPPDDSYGPWQINMLGSMGPERRKALGISTNTQLYDPAINARAMVMISKGGTDFSPWTTYKDGAYKHYLPAGSQAPATATQADLSSKAAAPVTAAVDAVGAAKDAAGLAISAANWIVNPSNWLRVAYVIGGLAVAVVGLDLLVENKVLGGAAKALGGEGGGTAASAGQIGRKIGGGMLAPARKAKAATAAAAKPAAPKPKPKAAAKPAAPVAS